MLPSRAMDEATARTWDAGIKLVGVLGFVIGGVFSYFTYFDGVERQERTALIEAQKPFLTERQALYAQASRAVAELATSSDPTVLGAAEATFWSLYWGPLATVESAAVEGLMVEMGRCLQDSGCLVDDRKRISLRLAQTIRAESSDAWNVYLPRLESETPGR